MYPAKPTTPTGDALQTFWSKGHAEYLSSDCGDELAIFADADHARCLRTRRLISAYYILYNGVLVSWACKKQPVTALHSTVSEITVLHKGATKTVLLRSFLQSIGFPLSSASPTYEDNTGTIKLIRTNHLTDIVHHHEVKISWLNKHYLNNNLKIHKNILDC